MTIKLKTPISIIAEGFEEKVYFDKLISLNVFSNNKVFTVRNVKTCSQIFPRFQSDFQSGRFWQIYIFCDGDKNSIKYQEMKNHIANDFFDGDMEKADGIIIFANPTTLQIVLSHFGDVSLTKTWKSSNADIVEKLTGVKNYDAHSEQLFDISNKINRKNYFDMKTRLEKISTDEKKVPSTNFLMFLKIFENDEEELLDLIKETKT